MSLKLKFKNDIYAYAHAYIWSLCLKRKRGGIDAFKQYVLSKKGQKNSATAVAESVNSDIEFCLRAFFFGVDFVGDPFVFLGKCLGKSDVVFFVYVHDEIRFVF